MSYRIIADSCCDKTNLIKTFNNITFVPLKLQLGDYIIDDDENFDQDDFIKKVLAFDGVAKTACPSPEAWVNAIDCEEDEIYLITITDKLSGTYNSAVQGVNIFKDDNPNSNKKIHIFNSLSTAGTESLIAEEIYKLKNEGKSFEEVVEIIDKWIVENNELYFCLESLDILKNNGRLFALAASLLEKLKVKLICKRTQEGNVTLVSKDLNMNRAIIKMAGVVADVVKDVDLSNKKLIVSHVCCEDRAKLFVDKLSSKCNFGEVEIVKCSGLNSTYASNGGILVSFTR